MEPIKSSYPKWARKHQLAFVEYLLKNGKNVSIEDDLIPMLSDLFKEFLTLSPEKIAMNFHIREYEKYVDDEKSGVLKKGATPYPKAVLHHNYMIINNSLESKYPKLRSGGKVKFLYCKRNKLLDIDVFAYNPGNYPVEIAPETDYIQQFFILIVEPINRILGAIGMSQINKYLKRAYEFKSSKSKKPLTEDQKYPLHVIDQETLNHEEVPEKFWKIIGNPEKDIPEEEFDEYLSVITKYGLNTVILINKNLKPFINRITKKKLKDAD